MAGWKKHLNIILNFGVRNARKVSKAVNKVSNALNQQSKLTRRIGKANNYVRKTTKGLNISQGKLQKIGSQIGGTFKKGNDYIQRYSSSLGQMRGPALAAGRGLDNMGNKLGTVSTQQALQIGQLGKQGRQFARIGKRANKYGQQQKNMAAGTAIANKHQMGFAAVMGLSNDQLNATMTSEKKFGKATGAVAAKFRMATHGAKGFRMEMLSLMFGGMQLQKTMMGLLKPALKASGIFKIFGTMLKVLFLPVALSLLKILLPIANWFMNLPAPVKKAIGALVLIGAAVGTLIMIIGQATLALGGMAIAFGSILAPILAIIAVIAAVILIIVYWDEIVKFFADTWSNLPGWIKGPLTAVWNAIKTYILGFWNILKGFIDFVVAIFTGDWAAAGKALGRIWKGIKQMFLGIWEGIFNWFILLPAKFFKAAIDLGVQLIKGFISGITQLAGMVADAIWSIIPEPFKGILKGATDVAGGLIGGIGNAISGAVPFLQGGGRIKESGLAVVHAGETVVPEGAGGSNNVNITINMNNEVSSDIDITRMADRLESELARRLRGKNL